MPWPVQKYFFCAIYARRQIRTAADIGVYALNEASVCGANFLVAGTCRQAKYRQRLLLVHIPILFAGRMRRPPVAPQPSIEIGFQNLERIAVAGAFTMQVEQIRFRKRVEPPT